MGRYLFADNSRDNLRVQRSIVALIFTYYRVMPEYLDFLTCFGLQSTLRDVRFSGFRQHFSFAKNGAASTVDSLGRSSCQYHVSYNLKGACPTGDGEWSIRNAAFYHRFDAVSGKSVWIVTKGRKDLYQSYEEMTGEDGREEDRAFGTLEERFISSLAPHMLFARWSSHDWRGYVRELEQAVDKESKMSKLGPRETGHLPRQYTSGDVRRMQIWEEQTSEVVVILEGNVEILVSLQQFYRGLLKDDRFPPGTNCAGEINDFANDLDTVVSDMRNSISRATALTKTTADRKELVSIIVHDERMNRLTS